jgi:hypothetical protein
VAGVGGNRILSEFICGFFFFIVGATLLIHNKLLVNNSKEFHHLSPSGNEEEVIFFNRILCILAGLITSALGYLTMLSSR